MGPCKYAGDRMSIWYDHNMRSLPPRDRYTLLPCLFIALSLVLAIFMAPLSIEAAPPPALIETLTTHEQQAKQSAIELLTNLKPLEALLRRQPDGTDALPPELRPQVTEALSANESLLTKIELLHALLLRKLGEDADAAELEARAAAIRDQSKTP